MPRPHCRHHRAGAEARAALPTTARSVRGHTGNTIGYTQFAAATEDGTRVVTVSVSGQITERTDPELLEQQRSAEETAVCQLLEGS